MNNNKSSTQRYPNGGTYSVRSESLIVEFFTLVAGPNTRQSSATTKSHAPRCIADLPRIAMTFIIRLRTRKGVKRLLFKSDETTWHELQAQVKMVTGVRPENMLLSRTPLASPNFVVAKKTSTLRSLNLKHGDMLHLGGEEVPESKNASETKNGLLPKKRFKLTARCQHGLKGRCNHCDPPPAGMIASFNLYLLFFTLAGVVAGMPTRVKCTHGPNAKCINCKDFKSKADEGPAAWSASF